MNPKIIIIRYGELSLKSTYVRNQFELKLVNNIKHAFALENVSCTVFREWGRIYLQTEKISEGMKILEKIFGITSFSPAIETTSELENIAHMVLQVAKKSLTSEKSFALRVTRTGTHDFTSQDVAVEIGKIVCEKTKARVNLTKPDVEICIEIRNKKAFIFTKKSRGPGGLPSGTQGKVLALVEDKESLAAAWFLMRRGCQVDFAVLNQDIKKKVDDFCLQWYVHSKCFFLTDSSQDQFVFLNEHALKYSYDAFVSGDKLGSVKDMEGMCRLKEKLCLPVLHPLVACGVDEVQKQMKKVGVDL